MVEFEVTTWIAAPPAGCFDLARDVDFHAESLAHTGERVVDRPGHRLLELEDEVEFDGRHFGVVQRHRARITALEVPNFFRDEMVRGAFRSFAHDHRFEPMGEGTLMRDRIEFVAPFGWVGWIVERVVLSPYLKRLIAQRGLEIKRAAEDASKPTP